MSAPTILNAFGRPTAYAGSMFASPTQDPKASERTRNTPRMDRDYWSLIPAHMHRMMISDSRVIARQSVVRGCLRQKTQYVNGAGWLPSYIGRSETFCQQAEDLLEQWQKICNVRGPLWHFNQMQYIGCQALDTDNDFFILLTETDTGYPKLQCFDAHQVHSRSGQTVVASGEFAGLPIISGVVYDQYGDEVAYQVLGLTAADDVIVSADNMIRVCDASWFSEGRGLSPISYALHEWYSYRDCQDNELKAQRRASSISLLESNADGMAPDIQEQLGGSDGASTVQTKDLDGDVRAYISYAGKLEAFASQRPSQNVAEFWKSVSADAIFAMEWRREMFDMDKSSSVTHAIADSINTTIHKRWEVMCVAALRVVQWAIAKFIKRGDLPADADWWMWEFPHPPDFSPNGSRTAGVIEAMLRLGITTEDNEIGSLWGTTGRRLWRKRARGIITRRKIADEYGISVRELGYVERPGDLPTDQSAGKANETLPIEIDAKPVQGGDSQEAAQAGEIQSTALNGAQVQSLVDLALKVSLGELPVDAARSIAKSAFPLIPPQDIEAIFKSLNGFTPTPKQPVAQ